MNRFILIGFTIIFTFIASAQNAILPNSRLPIKSITSGEGLSGNVALSCVQDQSGFIWIATQQGLTRYDGVSCTVYKNETNNPNSLRYDDVVDLALDSKGNLWIASAGGGVNYLDLGKNHFTHYLNDPDNPKSLRDNTVEIVFVDNMDNVWVSSNSDIGIDLLRKGKTEFEHFSFEKDNQNSLPDNTIYCINTDNNGTVWIGTANGLCRYNVYKNNFIRIEQHAEFSSIFAIQPVDDQKLLVSTDKGLRFFYIYKNKFENWDISEKYDAKNFMVRSMLVDSRKNYWLGSRNQGIIFISSDLKSFIHIKEDFRIINNLHKNDVRDFFEDSESNIWVSTFGGGINYINSSFKSFSHYNYLNSLNNQLSHNVILSFQQIDKNNIMLGSDGGGLFKFDKESGTFKNIPHDDITNVILSQHIDSKGNYWLGTYTGGLLKYDINQNTYKQFRYKGIEGYSERSDAISCIEEINGQLWIGTNGEGVLIFDLSSEKFIKQFKNKQNRSETLANNYIRSIYYDNNHTVWIGHFEGMSFIDIPDYSINHLNISVLDPNYIGSSCVNRIFRDTRELMWIATNGQGLLMMDQKKDTLQFFNVTNGLGANYIYGIEEDQYHNLWLSTNEGIIKCRIIQTDPMKIAATVFQKESGTQDKEFIICSYYQDDQGYLYFGGRNGFNVFHPSFFKDEEKLVNGLHLTDLKIFGVSQLPNALNSILKKDINTIDELKLNHSLYNFSLSFTSPFYSGFGKIRYSYKLENMDEDWLFCNQNNIVNYNHLPAGKYYFRVKASVNGVDWMERKPLTIILLLPWWKTWWFRLIFSTLIFAIFLGIYFFRVRILTFQKNILEEKVNERTRLIAQKNRDLNERNEEILTQKDVVEEQKNKLEMAYEELNKYRSSLEMLVEQRTQELQHAKEKAEESDELKSSFLSNLSHEIRTPLNSIIGFSDLLFNEEISVNERKSYHSIISNNSNMLLNLITDIIDFSKIEAHELELSFKKVKINTLLNKVEEIYYKELYSKQQKTGEQLEFYIKNNPLAEEISITTDESRLQQIISYLISNAIKFTNKGVIEVAVDLVDNNSMARFMVKDTGIGISKKHQNIIFEKFRKVEDQTEVLYRGAGLGLAITKNLVELLGGKIWVESEVGKGAAFYFIIPLDKKELQTKSKSIIVNKKLIPQLNNYPLIIAEDDISNYEYLRRLIVPTGAIIHHAINGKKVLEIIEREPGIRLILMDIKMPVLNGVDTLLELRNRKIKIPVIAQTAYAFADEVKRIKSAGFIDYLTKPIRKQDLYKVLEVHLNEI